jgi:N-acetylmuramoyl-L-alanine amidase
MQRTLRWTAVLVALLVPAVAAHARAHKSKTWADAQFAAAERQQEALEGRPIEARTRRDYDRVIDAYRRIYLGAPSSGRADPSVVAAAQMLEEMGRRFNDSDVLRSSIQQYEFLRREYPGSKNRFDALFRIGEIYKDDLHDKTRSDATFEEFLRRYPRNQFADAARQALAEPAPQQASLKSKAAGKAASKDSRESKTSSDSDSDDDAVPDDATKDSDAAAEADGEKTSRVLGIRHWSTPDYTRVAIDLEQGVKYESQRIDHPDRVFFDLLNTKLDPKLAGKTFDVSDGLLKDIRMAQYKTGRTRVVLDLDESSEFDASLHSNPPRLIIDIHNGDIHNGLRNLEAQSKSVHHRQAPSTEGAEEEESADKPLLDSATDADEAPAKAEVEKPARRTTVVLNNGMKKTIVDADDDDAVVKDAVVRLDSAKLDPPEIDQGNVKPISKAPSAQAPADRVQDSVRKVKRKTPTTDLDVREAQPTANGDRSLIRALGLKIGKIVIDPGHGGHDTGTIGPNGLEEKDLVLDVSRRLGKLLQTRLGAEVIYTRKDDTFIPLETRTAIANQEAADLFVSVHANSSHDPDARGVETYYLNFTSSSEALEVAARENAVSEKSIHELQDLVKKIALKEKIEESHEFASDVQNSLHSGLAAKNPGLRDRGVKKAPFIVLIGANMPSILAEISFVSNPGDERRLGSSDYRQKIAESLYRGIAKYVSGLSGIKVASKIDKDTGQ